MKNLEDYEVVRIFFCVLTQLTFKHTVTAVCEYSNDELVARCYSRKFQRNLPKNMFKFLPVYWIIISGCSYANGNSEMGEILHRPIRALSFAEGSTMGLFFALAVPLPDPQKSISVSYFFEATYELPSNSTVFEPWSEQRRKKRSIDRTTIYQTLENKFESSGFSGRACLLRSICETSHFNLEDNGVLGDIFHFIFTPSTSRSEDLPQDIVNAELIGQNGTCTKYHSNCPMGLFDLIEILV